MLITTSPLAESSKSLIVVALAHIRKSSDTLDILFRLSEPTNISVDTSTVPNIFKLSTHVLLEL